MTKEQEQALIQALIPTLATQLSVETTVALVVLDPRDGVVSVLSPVRSEGRIVELLKQALEVAGLPAEQFDLDAKKAIDDIRRKLT